MTNTLEMHDSCENEMRHRRRGHLRCLVERIKPTERGTAASEGYIYSGMVASALNLFTTPVFLFSRGGSSPLGCYQASSPPSLNSSSFAIATLSRGPGFHRRFPGVPDFLNASLSANPCSPSTRRTLINAPPIPRRPARLIAATVSFPFNPNLPASLTARRNLRVDLISVWALISRSGRPFFGGRPGRRGCKASEPFALTKRPSSTASRGLSHSYSTLPSGLRTTLNLIVGPHSTHARTTVNTLFRVSFDFCIPIATEARRNDL